MTGTIHWEVQFYNTQFPMTVISETFDLCTSKNGVRCPLTIGTHNITSSCRIDAGLPDVSAQVHAISLNSRISKNVFRLLSTQAL